MLEAVTVQFHTPRKSPQPAVRVAAAVERAGGSRCWSCLQRLAVSGAERSPSTLDANLVELATLLSVRPAAAPRMWLPPAKRALRNRRPASKAHGCGRGASGSARTPSQRCHALLHGRGLARTQRPRHRGRLGVDPRRQVRRAGGLLYAGYAGRRPRRDPARRRAWTYYNHNLDTAPDFYNDIISTRDYQDRLDTLVRVRNAGINVCCGASWAWRIARLQRAALIAELANLAPYPESVPINHLRKWRARRWPSSPIWTPRVCAHRGRGPHHHARRVRLSAGRQSMSEAVQALCFCGRCQFHLYGENC